MNLGVRSKLFLVSVGLITLSSLAAYAHLSTGLEELAATPAALAQTKQRLFAGLGIALGVGLLASAVVAHLAARQPRRLMLRARGLVESETGSNPQNESADEIGEFSRVLEQLAKLLSASKNELGAERDRTARVLDGMREGVLLLDESGRIALLNPALRSMLLLGPDVVGIPLSEATKNAELISLFDEVRDTRESTSAELELDGLTQRHLLVNVAPSLEDGNSLLAVIFDMTDIRRLETMRREFVANASHELRTPIASIRSAAETLRTAARDDPKATAQFVDMIDRNAERLQALVEDLLSLSQIESQEFRLSIEPLDLGPVIVQAVDSLRERASQESVGLTVVPFKDSVLAEADQRAIEQVVINLVDNAIKYSGAGTDVSVSAARRDNDVVVSIHDTGPGIAAEHLPRLFERFYRADPGRSRDKGGTGLGLAIVKHLVESMGGSVSVQSTVGVGSEFSVALPRPSETGDATATASESSP